MNAAQVRNAYRKSESQTEIHPVKLIHLMYERVLTHLDLAEQGLLQKDVRLRGENLSKAIAIISELNAAIKDEDNTEAAGFLRGLYSAILVELPRVGVSKDVEIIRQSKRYLIKLKEIWEQTALKEAGFEVEANGVVVAKSRNTGVKEPSLNQANSEHPQEKQSYAPKGKFKPVSSKAEGAPLSGVSFSI